METNQIKFWNGQFGKEYTERNIFSSNELDDLYILRYGISRRLMNEEFLYTIQEERDIKILEVGCNIGIQLRHLQIMGFNHLYGIELQRYAVEKAKVHTKNVHIIQGSIFDIPFKDGYFDLIFTSGVLIHIDPNNLIYAMKEICRCTKKYIWGFEYYSDKLQEIIYRGNKGVLWKQNFSKLFLDNFKNLTLVKEKNINTLMMILLIKCI